MNKYSPFYLSPLPFASGAYSELIKSPEEFNLIKSFLKNKTVFDIGCGDVNENNDLLKISSDCGVAKYVGVDIQFPNDKLNQPFDSKIKYSFIRQDLLEFFKSYKHPEAPVVLILFGVEYVNPQDDLSREFAGRLNDVLSNWLKNGDGVLMGNGTHGIKPEDFGCIRENSIAFGKFHVSLFSYST